MVSIYNIVDFFYRKLVHIRVEVHAPMTGGMGKLSKIKFYYVKKQIF